MTTNATAKIEKLIIGLDEKFTRKFENLEKNLDDLAILTKENFELVFSKFEEVDRRFEEIDKRFEHVDRRFDRIENVSIGNHERRIENIEDRLRVVETKTHLRKK